jgi:hypothetical protein
VEGRKLLLTQMTEEVEVRRENPKVGLGWIKFPRNNFE